MYLLQLDLSNEFVLSFSPASICIYAGVNTEIYNFVGAVEWFHMAMVPNNCIEHQPGSNTVFRGDKNCY